MTADEVLATVKQLRALVREWSATIPWSGEIIASVLATATDDDCENLAAQLNALPALLDVLEVWAPVIKQQELRNTILDVQGFREPR